MAEKNDDTRNALVLRQEPARPAVPTRLLGSLRDALLAAGREPPEAEASPARDRIATTTAPAPEPDAFSEATVKHLPPVPVAKLSNSERTSIMSDGNHPPLGGRAAKAAAPAIATPAAATAAPANAKVVRVAVDPADLSAPKTQPIARGQAGRHGAEARTQLLRGKQKVSRAKFHQDPVVGWLVIVGGPGLGAHRSIFEGNNTVGRSSGQRIPIDFGDDAISNEEQAYIRYDSHDRSFLFVPNLAKTNVVQVNDIKPTGAVALQAMDVITMGRTQLVFVPFCGADFDWAELSDVRE